METNQSSDNSAIARFWPRMGAFLLDCLILGAIGVAAALFLKEQFVQLGPWGRLLGFVVAMSYFGLLNSSLAGGQTLGKRLLKMKVVARDGAPLSVPKALVRFLPLGVPWFLNGAQLPESMMRSVSAYALSIVIFGIGFSVAYLFIFNRRSRQSLHDLLVGSYVVRAQASGTVEALRLWRGHLAVCTLLAVASAVAPYFTKNLAASEPFASLMDVYHSINSEPWVVNAVVNKGQTFFSSTDNGRRTTTYLAITAYTKDFDITNAARARQLAILALSADSSAKALDVIQVALVYGYDIGIASSWHSQNYAHSPAEWSSNEAAVQQGAVADRT